MAQGTLFGSVHSYTDLNLIQQSVEISPAAPRLNLIDVPGADGMKDLSEQPAGRVTYKSRTLSWTFALYPGDNWDEKHHQVSGVLNGLACKIILDRDPGYYYEGRLEVKSYKVDKALKQITIEATCKPYALRLLPTVVTADLSAEYVDIYLPNGRKPAVPTFKVTAETNVLLGGVSVVIPAGASYSGLAFELQPGANTIRAKTTEGAGEITITYQEGAL